MLWCEPDHRRGPRLLEPGACSLSGQWEEGGQGLLMCTSVKYTLMVLKYSICLV